MRKFLALLFTTVLATGAVQSAIAEETTIVEDPKNYIDVKQIKNSADENADNLDPSMGESQNRTYFDLQIDIVSPDEAGESLRRAFVCFYDSGAINESLTVDDLCGHSDGDDATLGTNDPEKALQIRMDHTTGGPGTFENEIDVRLADETNAHEVKPRGSGTSAIVPQFEGIPEREFFRGVAEDDRRFYQFTTSFALSHAANASSAWKVRVIADYNGTTETPGLVNFTDDKTYTVNWFGAFGTNGAEGEQYERTSVNYGEIFDFSTKPAETDIATGSYYANGSSNISLLGTPFKLDGSAQGEGEVPLADSVPFTQSGETFTGTNEFGLECKSGEETPIFVQAASKTLLPGVDASNTQANVEDPLTADTHDCTLSYGTGAALGRYTNAITVGLAPVS